MACLRSPWRLLSILCVLALFLPAAPTLPAGPSASAGPTVPERPRAAPAAPELAAPVFSPPPAGTLHTVSDNPQRSTAVAEEAAFPPAAEPGTDAGTVPEEIASVPGVSSDWWASVQEQIRQDMYAISSGVGQDGILSYRGHNLAHNWNLAFDDGGVRLIPEKPLPDRDSLAAAEASEAPALWTWGVRLSGYGHSGAVGTVGDLEATLVDGNRVEFQRNEVSEWYSNEDGGLRHGLILPAPYDAADGAPLVLELVLDTDLEPIVTVGEEAIDFRAKSGTVVLLRYGSLTAVDATGRHLPTTVSLTSEGARISIEIDAGGASFPLIVNPWIMVPGWEAVGQLRTSEFGYSVGTAGDVNGDGYADVIVGAPGYAGDIGKAYVYLGSARGLSDSQH